jgi:hypothetical protein
MEGKTKLYGGIGPVRYQKTLTTDSSRYPTGNGNGLLEYIKGMLGK